MAIWKSPFLITNQFCLLKYPVEVLKYNFSLLWSSAALPPPQCAMQRREATERKNPLVTTT
jgi:hypothetical protein